MKIHRLNLVILLSIAILIGISDSVQATAQQGPQGEWLDANWLNDQQKIMAESWNFQEVTHTNKPTDYFCYQVRFYQPNTFDPLHIYSSDNPGAGGEGPYSSSNTNGFYYGPKFPASNIVYTPSNHRIDNLINPAAGWIGGTWNAVLMKNGSVNSEGNCPGEVGELANSRGLYVPVDIPIPEFTTVAIPIAAVLGLVFFFQQRKKKEE